MLEISDCWLSAIPSPAILAARLSTDANKLTVATLQELTKDDGNFRVFPLVGNNGKVRIIQEPKRQLQRIHSRVHTLLSRVMAPDYLYSAVKGRSYVGNAQAHDPNHPTVKVDIKNFFPSIPRVAVYNFFHRQLKCRVDVAGILADLLTYDGHLATGSAASPILAYYSYEALFDEVHEFAKARGLKMTCYVDDMALSGPGADKSTLYEVKKIIARHGLRSHKAHAFSSAQPKVITGVCNTVSGPRVPNRLHLKIKNGFDALASASTQSEKLKALNPLIGRLEAAAQIEPIYKARVATLRADYADVLLTARRPVCAEPACVVG
ncbi:reverse transcriptase family protein [Rhodopseudomonas sp. HC1]|uniref:reverse transcriptase family protein n=1 Tax=Rhodopseudomonas infernalis TaxID=2897386 RepID=UPI001EE9A6D9|nr:reverse transcriptase family protein [Rhodopseudomonas infernalis]MCG6205292.1 reverse transcriptase family protein [Rhodopseudomonas infernalis]